MRKPMNRLPFSAAHVRHVQQKSKLFILWDQRVQRVLRDQGLPDLGDALLEATREVQQFDQALRDGCHAGARCVEVDPVMAEERGVLHSEEDASLVERESREREMSAVALPSFLYESWCVSAGNSNLVGVVAHGGGQEQQHADQAEKQYAGKPRTGWG